MEDIMLNQCVWTLEDSQQDNFVDCDVSGDQKPKINSVPERSHHKFKK